MSESTLQMVEMINRHLGGYNTTMGLRFVRAAPDSLEAQLEIAEHHLQAYGLVHGGVLTGMIESLCSVGAAVSVLEQGKSAVGLENSTSFLRAVRSGVLHGSAHPVRLGRRSHVWEAEIRDDRGRLVATGRVRLLILEAGAQADGEPVRLDFSSSAG
ncbi:MAG: PaaI family thioesterase [Acidobacteriota bacterium]|nr:PaaI family thioesterase [Acidobacteriota bacterium]